LSFVAETLGAALHRTGYKLLAWCVVAAGIVLFVPSFMWREGKEDELRKKIDWQTEKIDRLTEKIDWLTEKIDLRNKTITELLAQLPRVEEPGPRPKATGTELTIKAPADGSMTSWRVSVEGSSADPGATVWLVVHPMDVSAYWIQAAVNVKKDGRWNGSVYIGRTGGLDMGKEFEILALANPTEEVKEGAVLGRWPKAQWYSDVVTVVRE
jgi:hypothetical protein